jgi:hypothetical protein
LVVDDFLVGAIELCGADFLGDVPMLAAFGFGREFVR